MHNKNVLTLLIAVALASAGPAVRAQAAAEEKPAANTSWSDEWFGPGFWRLMGSPYTIHYHQDDNGDHEPIYMIGLERQRTDGWVFGGTYFSNSFGQPSAYVYLGEKVTDFTPWKPFFAQWTVGVLYGYKDPYEDKVPFNYHGFSPGATLSVGWQFTREFSAQAIFLGSAGLMLQVAIDLR